MIIYSTEILHYVPLYALYKDLKVCCDMPHTSDWTYTYSFAKYSIHRANKIPMDLPSISASIESIAQLNTASSVAYYTLIAPKPLART